MPNLASSLNFLTPMDDKATRPEREAAARETRKASRSKFVAEGDVGSLLCVDRLGSFANDSAAVSMNESRHSSTARQRSTSNSGATSRGGASLAIRDSGWDHAASFSSAGIAASVVFHLRTVSFSRFRPSLGGTKMSNALFQTSAMNSPQGAAPAWLDSAAGEGPVLCFPSVPSVSSFPS